MKPFNKILILGPCAAESEEQVFAIARELSRLPYPFIYRAGIWKPRTSPDTFQGVGVQGLSWLKAVQDQLHIPVCTEVATPEQVRLCLDAGITHLWIGARTSANPIAVQAIADTIVDFTKDLETATRAPGYPDKKDNYALPVTVYIKNPVNDDVRLWLGNIERLRKNATVIAIHRGCNHQPCWHMAHQLRQLLGTTTCAQHADRDLSSIETATWAPGVLDKTDNSALATPQGCTDALAGCTDAGTGATPVLLDPSHMSGDANKVPQLIALGMQLGYDGFMIEVHNDPAHALSDSKQQITPETAIKILKTVTAPTCCTAAGSAASAAGSPGKKANNPQLDLSWFRAEIDELDARLWDLIKERMSLVQQIGEVKRQQGLAPLQPQRYNEMLKQRLLWAQENGLPEDKIKAILDAIHELALSVQS